MLKLWAIDWAHYEETERRLRNFSRLLQNKRLDHRQIFKTNYLVAKLTWKSTILAKSVGSRRPATNILFIVSQVIHTTIGVEHNTWIFGFVAGKNCKSLVLASGNSSRPSSLALSLTISSLSAPPLRHHTVNAPNRRASQNVLLANTRLARKPALLRHFLNFRGDRGANCIGPPNGVGGFSPAERKGE